jgi:hypothetical protein
MDRSTRSRHALRLVTLLAAQLLLAAGVAGTAEAVTATQPAAAPSHSIVVAAGAAAASDGYEAQILPIDAATAAEMTGVSWRAGCPVPLSDLRLVGLTYWGFDNIAHSGELVVHTDVAAAAYLNRKDVRPGMIVQGDLVVTTFAKYGFAWGGGWSSPKDYQHLETSI